VDDDAFDDTHGGPRLGNARRSWLDGRFEQARCARAGQLPAPAVSLPSAASPHVTSDAATSLATTYFFSSASRRAASARSARKRSARSFLSITTLDMNAADGLADSTSESARPSSSARIALVMRTPFSLK